MIGKKFVLGKNSLTCTSLFLSMTPQTQSSKDSKTVIRSVNKHFSLSENAQLWGWDKCNCPDSKAWYIIQCTVHKDVCLSVNTLMYIAMAEHATWYW